MRTQAAGLASSGHVVRPVPGGLVRDLTRPEAYPPPRPNGIEMRQTHASWVFLTDHEAWKVKRPVNYGFLDYSDVEKRRRCCEEENRLGRRLAPDVYQGVSPIHARSDGHAFVGPGPIVDYAVRMHRLADEDSAGALLARDGLMPIHLQRLAERLTAFYESAPRTPEGGSPRLLENNITQNHQQCLAIAQASIDREQLNGVIEWQLDGARQLHAHLLDRVAQGRIREGHGDLRLEHVYFGGGRPDEPQVIDPIEFNRSFRCSDVALDVAFLAMELDAAQREDLAAWFLSSFARTSNDYDYYPLLNLYLSYRASVRAKVACFVAADPSTAPAKAQRKIAEAARLFDLAAAYAEPSHRKAPLVAVGGMIGAGKSTLADALCLELKAPVVSSDATRKYLAGLPATAAGDSSLYTPQLTAQTYDEVLRRAKSVLGSGRGVVLDATFRDVDKRASAMALARESDRPFLFVELVADEQTLRERLERRESTATVSDARAALLESFRSEYQPATELPPAERLVLDARLPVEELVRQVRAAL